MFSKIVTSPKAQSGFSLIEIMVGLVMGMLTVIVIMQTLSVAEGFKRTSTGAGDAQNSATIALFTLQRDLRVAGYGINTTDSYGPLAICTTGSLVAYNGSRVPPDITFPANNFAPFIINPSNIPAGDTGTDVIQVIYTNNFGMTGTGISFAQVSGSTDGDYQVTNRAGFRQGDLVLAVQAGLACGIVQITSLPGSGRCGDSTSNTGTNLIKHTTSSFDNFYSDPTHCSVASTPVWNKSGGLGMTFSAAYLYNLGSSAGMVVREYAIRNGRLKVCNMLTADCTSTASLTDEAVWTTIGDDVVSLKAEYGKDDGAASGTADDGTVDSWNTTAPSTYTDWKRIIAARVAVVARSKQYEKTTVTTSSAPSWQGASTSQASNPINLSQLPDWQHYRYRVLETTIPFRNMIWGR